MKKDPERLKKGEIFSKFIPSHEIAGELNAPKQAVSNPSPEVSVMKAAIIFATALIVYFIIVMNYFANCPIA